MRSDVREDITKRMMRRERTMRRERGDEILEKMRRERQDERGERQDERDGR